MKKREWVCTDPDCFQHGTKINDRCWRYIQYDDLRDAGGMVRVETIDLNDYTESEISSFCSGYYRTVEEMHRQYTKDEDCLQICCECIFEQHDHMSSDYYFYVKDEAEGEAYINSIVNAIMFSSGKEMLDYLLDNRDIYSSRTEKHAFRYNEEGSIAVYAISRDKAKDLEQEEEYWGAYLGPGGQIFDQADALLWCNDNYKDEWKDVTK